MILTICIVAFAPLFFLCVILLRALTHEIERQDQWLK